MARHERWRLSVLLLTFLLAGCQGLLGRQGPPADPLFVNRQPVETKGELTPPTVMAYSEPPLPGETAVSVAATRARTTHPAGASLTGYQR